ncbi:hypothetical protein N7486_008360 [Penicillium sp. IBT 16267x]|nr:hypothetical protein N7486_008360 [Penicillium sp. IBT 16267x]
MPSEIKISEEAEAYSPNAHFKKIPLYLMNTVPEGISELSMLSPNAQSHNAGLPPGPSNSAKRKRKGYSCFECRRRKLRCDRNYPTCSRCQKSGQSNSCFYDGPPPSTSAEPLAAPGPENAAGPKQLRTAPTPVARANYEDHRQPGLGSTLLSSLEADQNAGTWQHLSERAASQAELQIERPAVKADNEEPPLPGRTHDAIRNVIFRGQNFRTQYYGGSNAASLIGHVRCPEPAK